jgi:hypothetical protein
VVPVRAVGNGGEGVGAVRERPKKVKRKKEEGGGKGEGGKGGGGKKVKSDREVRALLRTDLTDEQERLFEEFGLK